MKFFVDRGIALKFDLASDPHELSPTVVTNDPEATALFAHCKALDQAYLARPVPDPSVSAELSAQLRALGYLRDDEEPAPKSAEESP